jgi:hypothetical protein
VAWASRSCAVADTQYCVLCHHTGETPVPRQHHMKKRPVSILILSLLFIVAGSVGLIYHSRGFLHDISSGGLSRHDVIDITVISLLRVVAIVSGIFMLYARNWARWLCLGWMGFHVVVSYWHTRFAFVFHLVLMIVIGYLLFRPRASEYFRAPRSA